MSRSRDLANLAGDATGLETLTVSDITDLTATATELNYVSGAGSAIQTQINSKIGGSNPTVTLGSNTTFGSGVSLANATFPSGVITNAKILTHATRTNVDSPNSTDREILAFGNYDKLNPGTKLVIHIVAPAFNFNTSGGVGVGIRYGSGSTIWGGSHYYTAENYSGFLVAYYYSDSHTTTGSQAVSLRSGQASGTGGRPCGVINPNTTDDGRIPQTRSTAFMYEIM